MKEECRGLERSQKKVIYSAIASCISHLLPIPIIFENDSFNLNNLLKERRRMVWDNCSDFVGGLVSGDVV